MDWDTLETDLSSIDIENSTYRITTEPSIEPLVASIGVLGLLNPPFLYAPDDRKHLVVSGFKRVAACLYLGYTKIHAYLLKPDTTPERIAEMAICDNAFQRSLNLVETSRSLNLLNTFVKKPSTLAETCRRLGLPDHPSMMGKIMRVCRMPAVVQEGLLEGIISLNTALTLDDLGPEAVAALVDMFTELHLSHSKQREILTNLDDLKHRDKIEISVLLQDSQLRDLLSNPETNRAQKVNSVRRHFRSKRFPFLTLTEETFQKESKKLPLGDNIRLHAPSGFESSEYAFTLNIKNLSDLERSIINLEKALTNPALEKILSLNKALPVK